MLTPRTAFIALAACCVAACAHVPETAEAKWMPIFDGKTLDGWTPKIRGYALGDNYRDTFRIENGAIRVSYDKYDAFGERFGHLFYKRPFKAFQMRMEYRFVDAPLADTPKWAHANSGVMIYSQDPASMAVEQSFPVSVEAQLLGPVEFEPRMNGNMCSPGTNVVMDGKLVTKHCINSTFAATPNGEWVKFEIDVSPTGEVVQKVNGVVAITYSAVQLDPSAGMAPSTPVITAAGGKLALDGGYICLQSEGSPIEFRNIEVRELR